MAPAYEADDSVTRQLRQYDQRLIAALRTMAIVASRTVLLAQATELAERLTTYVPPHIRVNLFYEQCLHCLWDVTNYLRAYHRQFGGLQIVEVQPLYQLKHRLLERLIILAEHCSAFAWQAGRSTDLVGTISVRLIYHTVDHRRRAKRLHWPIEHVPVEVRELIRERYGNFPPPDILGRET